MFHGWGLSDSLGLSLVTQLAILYATLRSTYDTLVLFTIRSTAASLTSAVLVAKIRKAPDIAETNAASDDTQYEVCLSRPLRPRFRLSSSSWSDLVFHQPLHLSRIFVLHCLKRAVVKSSPCFNGPANSVWVIIIVFETTWPAVMYACEPTLARGKIVSCSALYCVTQL